MPTNYVFLGTLILIGKRKFLLLAPIEINANSPSILVYINSYMAMSVKLVTLDAWYFFLMTLRLNSRKSNRITTIITSDSPDVATGVEVVRSKNSTVLPPLNFRLPGDTEKHPRRDSDSSGVEEYGMKSSTTSDGHEIRRDKPIVINVQTRHDEWRDHGIEDRDVWSSFDSMPLNVLYVCWGAFFLNLFAPLAAVI